MQERAHVLHILDLLKDTYGSSSAEEHPQRLPAHATLHLAHALRGVFYPAASTYPLTARFLLQRPEFDAGDVPLLYSTLYSADEGWRRERAWMVRFLADGMVGRREWRVLKRRHTWDLVASIFQSEERDLSLRRGVLEVRRSADNLCLTLMARSVFGQSDVQQGGGDVPCPRLRAAGVDRAAAARRQAR